MAFLNLKFHNFNFHINLFFSFHHSSMFRVKQFASSLYDSIDSFSVSFGEPYDSLTLYQYRLESLNTQSVQRRRTVEHYRMFT